MKKMFPPNTIKALYRCEKKEIPSPSLFPSKAKQIENSITSCSKCDICKNFLGSNIKFNRKVTDRVYNIRGKVTCNIPNVVYLISYFTCYDQYVGSALDFKRRFRIHKNVLIVVTLTSF